MAAVLLVLCFVVATAAVNQRPIVGVLSAPYDEGVPVEGSFFVQTYVQWLEQLGIRVAPIFYDAPQSELKRMWQSLNGILFTGGELTLYPNTTYFQTAQYLYDLTVDANLEGDTFPIWGICMGMQLLSILAAQSQDILERNAFDSENLPLPLEFTDEAYTSYLFGSAPDKIMQIFATENVTMNLHHDGVTPDGYNGNPNIQNVFNVLSTNKDRQGKEFLSTLEGKNMPLFGVQWHPERTQFFWDTDEDTVHSAHAVMAIAYVAQRFAVEVRLNDHHFATEEEETEALIYNYTPTYDGEEKKTYRFPQYQ
ncbi:Gamma-glutamyl hydrolase A [Pelomyxa schiedti]|nr:Gamma-glutamyl hydrolase A [Pelomyxa schiedti]